MKLLNERIVLWVIGMLLFQWSIKFLGIEWGMAVIIMTLLMYT